MFFARTILTIGFSNGVVFLTPLSGQACGFNWMRFGGYFECCDDSGYVVLTEKLADLSIPGESESFPIWMFFDSSNTAPSPYAGMWRIGILNVSLVQTGENQFRVCDPGGNATRLSWDREKNVLKGCGWKGSFTGDRAKLCASCGWSIEFDRGKVSRMVTPHNKTLVYAYADGFVSSVTCDGKPLIVVGSLKGNTLDITVNGRKLGIVKTDQPCVQRVGKANVIRGTEKSLHEITGRKDNGTGCSYTYSVDEKMRPMIIASGKNDCNTFTLVFDPQTRKIVRWKDWEYTKTSDRKDGRDTIELSRKNSKGEIESVYRDIEEGVDITRCGGARHCECRFTSGPAAGKVRRIMHEVDGKLTHFEKYAYDEKGRPIRGQENDDKLRFEYDDTNRTAVVWRNNSLQWKKFMDTKNRIVKVEYPGGKELRLTYKDSKVTRPAEAVLIKGGKRIAVQLDSEGLIKQETAVIRSIP